MSVLDAKLLRKFGEVQVLTKPADFAAGKGTIVVEEVFCDNLTSGLNFSVRGEIVEASSILDPRSGQESIPNRVGESARAVAQPTRFKAGAISMKAHMLALTGAADLTGDDYVNAVAEVRSQGEAGRDDKPGGGVWPVQPTRGMLLGYSAIPKLNEAGQWRIWPRFTHVSKGNSPEEVAARRADLDARKPLHFRKE